MKSSDINIQQFKVSNFIINPKTNTLTFDAISLLVSCLISPKPNNIQSLKLQFGLKLSDAELNQQLKNPNSLLHRIVSEIVFAYCKYIFSIKESTIKLLKEQIRTKEIENEILDDEREAKRAISIKSFLKKLDWQLASSFIHSIEDTREDIYQTLMKQNVLELIYLLGVAITEEAKKQILGSIIKRNIIMEQEAVVAKHLSEQLNKKNITTKKRERIIDALTIYETHRRLSTLDKKLIYIKDHMEDPDKIVQVVNKNTTIEEFNLKVLQIEESNYSSDNAGQNNSFSFFNHKVSEVHKLDLSMNEILRNLAIALDLFSEKNNEINIQFSNLLLRLIDNLSEYNIIATEELVEKIKEDLENIAQIVSGNDEFKDFRGVLKKAFETKIISKTDHHNQINNKVQHNQKSQKIQAAEEKSKTHEQENVENNNMVANKNKIYQVITDSDIKTFKELEKFDFLLETENEPISGSLELILLAFKNSLIPFINGKVSVDKFDLNKDKLIENFNNIVDFQQENNLSLNIREAYDLLKHISFFENVDEIKNPGRRGSASQFGI